jgi:hypothetical protein
MTGGFLGFFGAAILVWGSIAIGCGDDDEGSRMRDDTRETGGPASGDPADDTSYVTPPLLPSGGDTEGDTDSQGALDTDTAGAGDADTDSATDTMTPDICKGNTREEAACRDCCDCLLSDCTARLACRDACASHNYGNNRYFIDFDVPSDDDLDGDYTTCLMRGEDVACFQCCDCVADSLCGDLKHCRAACEEGLY